MKYDLSIVIAHFKPKELINNPLIKTISEINNQKNQFNIEIIIADDGSLYDYSFEKNYSIKNNFKGEDVYILENQILNEFLVAQNLNISGISKWAHYPKINNSMNKAFITNCAVNISKSENLLLLDDDNYFISSNTIENIIILLKSYNLIIGQIQDNNNRIRNYKSNRVQGTTICFNKQIFDDINGLGEWTEEFSCGVDSDLWIKLFNYNKEHEINICYTNRIQTYDSCSKRWKKYTKIFKDYTVRKEFMKLYGIKNYKSVKHNPSRNKNLWIKNLID